jgi:hypothetical protein
MSTKAPFPRAQHWTTGKDGFRVSILLYRSSTEQCTICGHAHGVARHCVMADGRGLREGFSGGPAWFCDAHRPPRGPLPPLDYKRLVQGADKGAIIHERLAPYPEHGCTRCGDPALFEVREQCAGCEDLRQHVRVRGGGGTGDVHMPHDTGTWWACASHSPVLAAAS